VHPESPEAVVKLADAVGSSSQLISAAKDMSNDTFIVATDRGIFYKMKQMAPEKRFLEAPTGGNGATCRSCAHCPWMAMNALDSLVLELKEHQNEVQVDIELAEKAMLPLNRMLAFSEQLKRMKQGAA